MPVTDPADLGIGVPLAGVATAGATLLFRHGCAAYRYRTTPHFSDLQQWQPE
jgi:hypothetical protein